VTPSWRHIAARALDDVRQANPDTTQALVIFSAARALAARMSARYLSGRGVVKSLGNARGWAEVFAYFDAQVDRDYERRHAANR
jgi:hypothetical protein